MIVRARTVVTMDGPPIENGAVVISGDRVLDIGKFPEVFGRHAGEEIVDLGEQALLPGLINAHCHLDYTCLRGKIPRKNLLPTGFAQSTRKRRNFLSKTIGLRSQMGSPRRKDLGRRRSRI